MAEITCSFAGDSDGGCVSSLSLLVVLAAAGFSEGIHAVDLVLGANSAEVVNLADGTIHALLQLFHGKAEEALASHDLDLLGHGILLTVAEAGLPLCDTEEHVLLGLVKREDCGTFATLDGLDERLGWSSVEAEGASEDVLTVEGREHGDVATDANSCDEKLVCAATHSLNLSIDDLLHVGKALRLEQILSLVAPGATTALVVLLDDNRCLDGDDIYKLVKAE